MQSTRGLIYYRYFSFLFLLTLYQLHAECQQVKLILPIGHTNSLMYASFNPDASRIVTASKDKTAKIWDASTGDLLADLTGHTSFVYSTEYSPDGKRIVTASFDKTAKVWDAFSAELLFTLKHDDQVWGAHFSKDGKKILTCSVDKTAKIWDANTGQLLLTLTGHEESLQAAEFSPDGKFITTASYDNTAKLWDANTGKLITTCKSDKNIYAAHLSNDGKTILTASEDSTAKLWDASSGAVIKTLSGHQQQVWSAVFSPDNSLIATASFDGVVRLWDARSGNLKNDLNGHKEGVWFIQFSPDGKKLLTSSTDRTAKCWDATTGKVVIELTGHKLGVSLACFSGDGKKILTASDDKTASIWDAASGKLIKNLKGYTSGLWSISVSPDGQKILTASGDNAAKIWSIKDGKITYELKGHSDSVTAALFNPDGKKIVTISKDKTAKIWDADNGNLLADLKRHSGKLTSVAFSADGRFLATGSDDKTIKIWDAGNGVFLNECLGHKGAIAYLNFSKDGSKLVSASRDSTAKIWDAATGKMLQNLNGNANRLLCAEFNKQGTKVVTTGLDSIAKVWDVNTGAVLISLKGHSGTISSGKFSPDDSKILTASGDGLAKIWDASTGALIRDLKGHSFNLRVANWTEDGLKVITASRDNSSKVFDVATGNIISDFNRQPGEVESGEITKGGKNIVTAAARTTVSIWNPKDGSLLYTFFTVGGSDYLIVDKDGHYDGTEAARKLLYFTCGTEVISLDQLKDRLWVPNLAERIMSNDPINNTKLSDLNICAYTPKVEKLDKGSSGYNFKITPRSGGLGETVLYVNNIEVHRYKPAQLEKSGSEYLLSVKPDELKQYFIIGSENKVMVKSYVSANDVSSRGIEVEEKAVGKSSSPPNLYAVIIGVSDYKGDGLDLKYAAKDAGDISNALTISAGKLLGKEHIFTYNLTTDKEHYRLPEKQSIKELFAEIGKKASANDILMIFFAGHGVLDGDKKQFYFLTADASASTTSGQSLQDVGIGAEELMDWIKPATIKAQKRVLVLDACHSGSAINQMVDVGKGQYTAARSDDKSQEIKQIDKLNEKSGLYILAASASNQSAYEMAKYSQGLLTYSLLKVIKEHPELLEDSKYLNVSSWFNQTVKVVSDIVRESNLRQEPQLITTTNFNIGIVDPEVLAKIILPNEKPLFATSNFQNSDENIADDDLELSKIINQQLNDVASRSTDGAINFVTSSNAPDAWSLTGRYTVKDDEVTVKTNIKQNKAVKNTLELKGKKSDLKALAAEIVVKATEWILKK